MAVKPQDNAGFLREVDEEVRKQQAIEFWQRWGKWIAVLVIVGLAALGGWLYWSSHQTRVAETQTEELAQILQDLDDGRIADVEERLAALGESSRPGIRAAALLTSADFALQQGENDRAIELFAEIAGDDGLPQQYRDLALIRQTATEFQRLEPQQVIDRLAGLAQPGNPWFGSAGELTAIALMRLERNQAAGELFAQIANDEDVPETMRTRAVQMAGVLGVDAVPDEPVVMEEMPAAPQAAPVEQEAN